MDSITESITCFASQMYSELRQSDEDANLFFSPMSIFAALSMTMAGAKNKTLSQMESGLSLKKTNDDLHAQIGSKLSKLTGTSEGVVMELANKIYIEKTYDVVESFATIVQSAYHAEIEKIDFISNPKNSRVEMNTWVETLTKKKIANLLPDGSITGDTRLVLLNAIYFKGLWEDAFKHSATTDGDFFTLNGNKQPVKMMSATREYYYNVNEELDCSMIKLKFKSGDFSLMIVLPNARDGLPKLEEVLDGAKLQSLLSPKFRNRKVVLTMPRFKLESSFSLKDQLMKLGMVEMFDQRASDFSGMSPENDLVVSSVVHKAFIEVDEEGAEAAAATAVVMNYCMAAPPQPTPVFTLDHPALILIVDKSNSPVFFGRLMHP